MSYVEFAELMSYAENISANIASGKKVSTGKIPRSIKSKLKYIKHATLQMSSFGSPLGVQPKVHEWICDNRYMAEREGRSAALLLKKTGKLPGSKKGLPKVFVLALSLIRSGNGELSSERIETFITGAGKAGAFSEVELWLFVVMLKAGLVYELYDVCKALEPLQGSDKVEQTGNEVHAELLQNLSITAENIFTSFRMLTSTDFRPLLHNLSSVEEILNTDPSGIYPQMDEESRSQYRRTVSRLAHKQKMSEKSVAEEAIKLSVQSSDPRKSHVGYFLNTKPLGKKHTNIGAALYFISLLFLTFLLSIGIYPLAGIAATILLIIPLSDVAKNLVDTASLKLRHPTRLPRLDLNNGIPEGSKTLCVIAALMAGLKDGAEYASLLEKYMLANRNAGPHLLFGILGDYKDSDSPFNGDDEAVLEATKIAIAALNSKYGERFFLFTRKKVKNTSYGNYSAWERKRGALLQLTDLLLGRDSAVQVDTGKLDNLSDIKYVITLDADTKLTIGSATELVGTMLHPLNHPVVDPKLRLVKEGHALLQPRISVDLESASKSFFSRAQAGLGGTDPYCSTVSDLYQDLFDEGSFTGKGIFDVRAFSECLSNRFPENHILSHDLLEGCYLRSGLVSDVELTDGFPHSVSSYFKRLHRWTRGDWQLSPWLFPTVPSHDGTEEKNPLNSLSKWKIFDNLRRSIVPIFTFAALILGLFFGRLWPAAAVAVAIYLSGLMLSTASAFLRGGAELGSRYHSSIMYGLRGSAAQALLQLMLLPYNALMNLDAILTSLYRMIISKKRLLTWVTAAQVASSSPDGVLAMTKQMYFSVICGFVALISSDLVIAKILATLWILSPLISSMISRPSKTNKPLSQDDQNFLHEQASLMWKYFENLLDEKNNYLPPDNWQHQPAIGVARRTSPTNIGLGLLSCLSAADMGIIPLDHALDLIDKMIASISKLRMWKGHLLNWYETDTLRPLHPLTVSAVDSGNYAGSLIALIEGLNQSDSSGARVLAIRAKQLLDDMDFLPLYDAKRKLFYISLDTETGKPSEGWYDLLASEARQTSYLCVARGVVDKKHWGGLGRALVQKNGYAGMASWTGTMFEYLMPNLLMPSFRNSLIYESLMFCVYCQKLRGSAFKIPWGISESAYFAFDRSLSYRYKAHGVQRLGFKRGLNRELVISPYSSFLALEVAPAAAVKNLRKLKNLGLQDIYGLYEAADFTPSRLIGTNRFEPVKCYMAHHLGMSIVACNNILNSGIMQNRFMSNPEMAAYSELLQERTPVDAVTVQSGYQDVPDKSRRYGEAVWSKSHIGYDPYMPRTMLLSNGSYTLLMTDTGLSKSISDRTLLTRFDSSHLEGVNGIFFFIRHKGGLYPLTPAPMYRPDVQYSSEFDERTVKLFSTYSGIRTTISSCVSAVDKSELREIMIHSDVPLECELVCYYEPVLSVEQDHYSHPAFSKLFVQTSAVDSGILIKRRDKTGNLNLFSAFLCSKKGFSFDTSRERALGRGGFANLANALELSRRSSQGSVLDPCVLLTLPLTLDTNEIQTIRFALSCSSEETAALATAERTLNMPLKQASNYPFSSSPNMLLTPPEVTSSLELLTDMTFVTPRRAALNSYISRNKLSQSDLWKFGISGDLPILSVLCTPESLSDRAIRAIKQQRFLTQSGVNFDLVLLLSDMSDYNRPTRNSATDLIRQIGGESNIGVPSGVHFVEVSENSDDFNLILSCSFAAIDLGGKTVREPERTERKTLTPPALKSTRKTATLRNPVYNPDGSFSFSTGGSLPAAAWSNLLVNENLGMVSADSGSGYMWYLNARENRINSWTNDTLTIDGEERIQLIFLEGAVSLFSANDNYDCTVTHGFGYTTWEKNLGQGTVKTTAFVHKNQPIRMINVEYSGNKKAYIRYFTGLQLGEKSSDRTHVVVSAKDRTIRIDNRYSSVFRNHPVLFKTVPDYTSFTCDRLEHLFGVQKQSGGAGYDPCVSVDIPLKNGSALILTGVASTDDQTDFLDDITTDTFSSALKETTEYWHDLITPITIQTPSEALNQYINGWALYQTVACRIMGRTSMYQSGGAYGFRDQLQDVLAAIYANPEFAKAQILRAAAHQFPEGDVQHWWHTETETDAADKGVRTRCTDDLLWLPYTVWDYIEVTGDLSILEITVPFIQSEPLRGHEQERYEVPTRSDEVGTIYAHCTRAIDLAIRRGEGAHGLCFIGSGDWNDGFNEVGKKGLGESTWLTWFFTIVLNNFSEICIKKGDKDSANRYNSHAQKLITAAEEAWDGEWYIRGYFDSGSPLGSKDSDECRIDSIAQSFSAISGSNRKKSLQGVKSAIDHLVDRENRIVKLFTPPFQHSKENPGYIKGYSKGVRENGGQYTHASTWLAMACFRLGLNDNGYEILDLILPATHNEKTYRVEPYVVSADVYSAENYEGRGGWSWYTGSSSWYYTVTCKELLGISIKEGNLLLNPHIPSDWDSFSASIRHKSSHWSIQVQRTGTNTLTIDGNAAEPNTPIPPGTHTVLLTL